MDLNSIIRSFEFQPVTTAMVFKYSDILTGYSRSERLQEKDISDPTWTESVATYFGDDGYRYLRLTGTDSPAGAELTVRRSLQRLKAAYPNAAVAVNTYSLEQDVDRSYEIDFIVEFFIKLF